MHCERTFVVREIVLHWAHRELLLEPVNLVQEQDNAGLDEPSRVANTVEKCKGLLHSVDSLVFEEQLIVFGDGDQEENGCDIFEAMNPLLSLGSLATNIKHTIRKVLNNESRFGDTGSLDSRSEHILIVGKVIVRSNAVDRVEIAGKGSAEVGL
jgi:hypothetical protein